MDKLPEPVSSSPSLSGEVREKHKQREFNIDHLKSQKFHIPNLWPAFAAWKRGINPLYHANETNSHFYFHEGCHSRQIHNLREAINSRLEQLIQDDPVKLAKAKAVDLGLFAACLFPDVDYHILETGAFYLIWLFFWDDAIDSDGTATSASTEGGDGDGDIARTVEAGRRYRDQSVAYIHACIGTFGGWPPQTPSSNTPPPTVICGSFNEVARRIKHDIICEGSNFEEDDISSLQIDEMDLVKIGDFRSSLERYMDACVVEQAWRLSSRGGGGGGGGSGVPSPPSEEEFWGWRLGTSSVDALLDFSTILNKIRIPLDVLMSKELDDMRLAINKLLVCINELFSLKKELKDTTAHMNLIPITMHASEDPTDLDGAVKKIVNDIYAYARDFNSNANLLRRCHVLRSAMDRDIPVRIALERFDKLVAAYQAVVTGVLHFSIVSPRYGILKDRLSDEEGGGFLVTL